MLSVGQRIGILWAMFCLDDEAVDRPLIDCKVCKDSNDFSSFMVNSNYSSFKVIHQNIRSYRKNIEEFMVVLQSTKVKFNCIILTEAWLGDDSDLISLDGYSLFRSYNSLNISDGVVVYMDSSLSASCSQLCLGGVATALSVTFNWDGLPSRLLAVYRSPNSDLNLFIDAIGQYCSDPVLGAGVSIVAGDINCDTLSLSRHAERYLDVLYESGFVPCINIITRPASLSCIDHIFVKNARSSLDISSFVIETFVTDHYSICLEIKSPGNDLQVSKPMQYKIVHNNDFIKNKLSLLSWEHVTSSDDVNTCVNYLLDTLKSILDQSMEKIQCNARNSNVKPWITNGLLKSIRHRDKIYRKLRSQPFNADLRIRYNRYRNRLHSLIKQAKFKYYKYKIQTTSGDPKKFWSVVNEIAGRPVGGDQFPVEAYCDRADTITQIKIKEISQSFNDYFASVGQQLAGALRPVGHAGVEDADHAVDTVFVLRPITREELLVVVKGIKGGSAPGIDGIRGQLIKDNIQLLVEPLLHIINLSIRTGQFPNALKMAKVIPVHKSGLKSLMSNFRPISLLTTLSKLLEKSVKYQLTNYLESHDIIIKEQYGFRKNKNTSHALFDITKLISTEYGKKNKILITFLDLAKAFDTVERHKLIQKLKFCGIIGTALRWFVTYFEGRSQKVYVNGVESNVNSVDYGVVQGSTLGPLLFLIYVNNITKLSLKSRIFLFADDTAVVSMGCTWDEVYSRATEDLAKVKTWFDHNTLTVNIDKTKCLPIYARNDADPGPRTLRLHSCGDPRSVTCGCGTIERVAHYKYLGVIIDHKLSWMPHIQCIKQRLRKLIYAFMQLSQVLTVDQLRTVYFAHVQSLLQYGILAWGGASTSVLEPLAVTQRTIIKIILRKGQRFPTNLLLSEFPVLTIKKIFIKELLIFTKSNMHNVFSNIQHNYPTRNRVHYGFQIPRLNNTIEMQNSFYIAHFLRRRLPRNIILAESESVEVYKRRIGRWLLQLDTNEAGILTIPPYT